METLVSVLIVGMVALFFLERQHAGRLRRIERELASLRTALAKAPRIEQAAESPEPILPPKPGGPQGGREIVSTWFERVVAGRLLIWTGGVALAAGGVFLIRHSIELVTPGARMIAAALLGLVLIAAGEGARRGRLLSGDPRIAQALVGAGIAVLYAAAYGSNALYALIAGGVAAMLMVLITAAALVLSLRHGAPTAALGLVGGFTAPLLVGVPEAAALPVLFYVALLDAAIFAVAWRRGWRWLVAAAVAASFAWTGWFILRGPDDALAAGIFAALFGISASLPALARKAAVPLVSPLLIALAELALLVARDDLGAAAWALFGAVATAGVAFAAIRPGRPVLGGAALLIALGLIAFKAGLFDDPIVPWAAVAATVLFAGGLFPAAAHDRAAALSVCIALAGPLLIMRGLRPEWIARPGYGAIALLLALAGLALLWSMRRARQAKGGAGAIAAAGTAALLAALGAYDIAPSNYVSAVWLILAVGLLLAGIRIGEEALRTAGLGLLTVTVVKVFLIDAAALEGVLRILSFLGLGFALIGIGIVYGKLLRPAPSPATPG